MIIAWQVRRVLSRQPRAAIGFELVSAPGPSEGGHEGEPPPPRASLKLGDEWTISCWFSLPLPPPVSTQTTIYYKAHPNAQSTTYRVLAMGLPPMTEAAPSSAAAAASGAAGTEDPQRILPVCHVLIQDKRAESDNTIHLGVGHADRKRSPKLLESFDLQSLPHGWHHLAAVGANGTTTFYVDGRCRGSVSEQVTADIHWLGNVTASDGRPCGAFGTLADLRVYNDALSRRQVQELDAAGTSRDWGAG